MSTEQRLACRRSVWHEGPVTHQGLIAAAEGVDLGRQYEPTLAVVETNEYVDMLEVGSGPVERSKNAGKGPVSVCFLLTTNTVGFMWLWVPQFLKPSKFLQIPAGIATFRTWSLATSSQFQRCHSHLRVHTALPRYRHVVQVVATPLCHQPQIAGIVAEEAECVGSKQNELETSRLPLPELVWTGTDKDCHFSPFNSPKNPMTPHCCKVKEILQPSWLPSVALWNCRHEPHSKSGPYKMGMDRVSGFWVLTTPNVHVAAGIVFQSFFPHGKPGSCLNMFELHRGRIPSGSLCSLNLLEVSMGSSKDAVWDKLLGSNDPVPTWAAKPSISPSKSKIICIQNSIYTDQIKPC